VTDVRRQGLDISFEKLWQINLEMKRLRLVRETMDSVVDFREMEVLILPRRSPPGTVVGMPTFVAHKVRVPIFLASPPCPASSFSPVSLSFLW